MSRRAEFCVGEGWREGEVGTVKVALELGLGSEMEGGDAMRGVKARWSLLRVLEETPAPVSSPKEPRKRAMPCRRIKTETSMPMVSRTQTPRN